MEVTTSANSNTSSTINVHHVRAIALVCALLFGTLVHHTSTIDSSSDAHSPSSNISLSINDVGRFLQQDLCTNGSEECCRPFFPSCSSTSGTSSNPLSSLPYWVQISFVALLLAIGALFSGLTLSFLSLDLTGLEIVMEGDDPQQARYARNIYPVRKNGNLLLCTMVLGNVASGSLVSILLADKAGGVVGFALSTVLLVIFVEIVPQSICARFPLELGSCSAPMIKPIIVLFFPIAYPMAWCLNKALGKELATTYTNAEMLKLLQIQVEQKVMDHDTATTMAGAMKYKKLLTKDVMTKASDTFMLSAEETLNFETLAKIFKTGYSRIPVYEVSRVSCM
jgi:metal transporter CNNM